jgi:hypothetical protein
VADAMFKSSEGVEMKTKEEYDEEDWFVIRGDQIKNFMNPNIKSRSVPSPIGRFILSLSSSLPPQSGLSGENVMEEATTSGSPAREEEESSVVLNDNPLEILPNFRIWFKNTKGYLEEVIEIGKEEEVTKLRRGKVRAEDREERDVIFGEGEFPKLGWLVDVKAGRWKCEHSSQIELQKIFIMINQFSKGSMINSNG